MESLISEFLDRCAIARIPSDPLPPTEPLPPPVKEPPPDGPENPDVPVREPGEAEPAIVRT